MANFAATALFYPVALAASQVQQLMLGGVDPSVYDVIDFPDEAGGEATRELAVPLLAGMDEIEVDAARLVLRAQPRDMDIDGYSVSPGPQGKGIFLVLQKPARVKKIELRYTAPVVPGQTIRVVVRQAEPSGSGFGAGPPVFASPDFAAPGPMFARVLTGMTLQAFGGGRTLVSLRAPLAGAWLIQVATGNDPTELTPVALQPTVARVTVEALPRDLSVDLETSSGRVPLWSHPDVLLPEGGDQEVSFTPLARKVLNEILPTMSTGHTLALRIRFTSASGAAVAITGKTLSAHYIVRPLGTTPARLRLGGERVRLTLEAPAALRSMESSIRATATLLGRELNPASPDPSLGPAPRGLRVSATRGVAGAAAFEGPNALVSARIFVATEAGAEAVLELRADAAGAPGAPLAPPAVATALPNFRGWLEFELPGPVPLASQTVWLSLRVNTGEVYWFQGVPGQPVKVTPDRGQTWGAPAEPLTSAEGLHSQLFQASPAPLPPPTVRLEKNGIVLDANLMSGAEQKTPTEYAVPPRALPASASALLAATVGNGRVPVGVDLFSRQVVDLSIDELALHYDPFQAGGA